MATRARGRSAADSATLSASRRRAILLERTRRLAVRREREEEAPAERVLLCRIGANLYGLPLGLVAKVKAFARRGVAAGAHPAMLGLAADEGQVRPVFDLATLLGAGPAGPGDGWLVLLAPPLKPALRLDVLPVAADVTLSEADPSRARVLAGEDRDKVLVMIPASDLLALIQSTSHGAAAP